MSYVKAQLSVPQIEDANGNPASGYTISSYIWDTSTPTPMYTSSAGAGSATSFTLNSLGQPQSAGGAAVDIFLDEAITYKFIIRDSEGSAVGPTIGPILVGKYATSVRYTQSGTGAVERYANAKMGEIVSVKDFGATGDGVTDDTAAIQAALDYAALVFATVLLPRGDYRTSDALVLSSTTGLRGEGLDQSSIRYYGVGGSAIELAGTVLLGKVKCSLEGFAIYDNGSGVNGINMSYCHYSVLRHLRIFGFTIGLTISNCWNNEYEFIITESNTQDGINLSSVDANALNFVSCLGTGNGRAGFYAEGGRSVLCSGCTWEANTQYGVYLAGGASGKPLNITFHENYIEGNGTFEFYSDSATAHIPSGIIIRDCYFEFLPAKAVTAIRIADISVAVIDGCTFDNLGGAYTNSLYMAAGGSISHVKFGQNYDSSSGGVYSDVYYKNESKLEAKAWGRFTVSGAAIATTKVFGVTNITRISAGIYEITLQTAMASTDYCVSASAENGASFVCMFCNPSPPSSSTVFRISTSNPSGANADARTVSFVVYD